jgi:hypothetical protein
MGGMKGHDMSAYVHTCDQCGAQMQVHDRYAGRTLKCTTCRTEFVAEAPQGPAGEAPAEPELRYVPPEKNAKRFLPLLLLLIPLAGFLVWLGGGDETPATAFRDQHAVGEVAALDTGTTRPVLVALNQDAVAALVDMRTGSIQMGVSSLMTNQDKYLELEAGTKVRVLAYANEDREARVRVVDGPQTDLVVWVPRRWLR